MKKILLFVVLVVVAFLYRHKIVSYFGKAETIDLTELNAPLDTERKRAYALTLKRGTFAYIFYKRKDLPEKSFRVADVDVVPLSAERKDWPEQAYARIIDVVAMDNEAAARAVKASVADTSKGAPPADPADVKELNSAKFTVGILPAKKAAKEAAKAIVKGGSVQIISGTHYELGEVMENGVQVLLKDSRAVRHIFYADDLMAQ